MDKTIKQYLIIFHLAIHGYISYLFISNAPSEHGDMGGLLDVFEKIKYFFFSLICFFINILLLLFIVPSIKNKVLKVIFVIIITSSLVALNQFICNETYRYSHFRPQYSPNSKSILNDQISECDILIKSLKKEDYQQETVYRPDKELTIRQTEAIRNWFQTLVSYGIKGDTLIKKNDDSLRKNFSILRQLTGRIYAYPLDSSHLQISNTFNIYHTLYSPDGKHMLMLYTFRIPMKEDSVFNYNHGTMICSMDQGDLICLPNCSGSEFVFTKQLAELRGLKQLKLQEFYVPEHRYLNVLLTKFWANYFFKHVKIDSAYYYGYQVKQNYLGKLEPNSLLTTIPIELN